MSGFSIEFLTRPGCHLCEEAEPGVRRVAKLARSGVIITNIDLDPESAVDWDLRVPVVLGPDREVLAEGRIRSAALLRAVLRTRFRRLLSGTGL